MYIIHMVQAHSLKEKITHFIVQDEWQVGNGPALCGALPPQVPDKSFREVWEAWGSSRAEGFCPDCVELLPVRLRVWANPEQE